MIRIEVKFSQIATPRKEKFIVDYIPVDLGQAKKDVLMMLATYANNARHQWHLDYDIDEGKVPWTPPIQVWSPETPSSAWYDWIC